MEYTILQQDISEISAAIKTVMGIELDELKAKKRTGQDKLPAKVAFCHFLQYRGHDPATIATIFGTSRNNIYRLLSQHENMLFGDTLYRRSFDSLKQHLKPLFNEN